MKGRKATAGGGSAKLGFGPECFTCLTLVVAVVSPCLVFLCERGPPMRSSQRESGFMVTGSQPILAIERRAVGRACESSQVRNGKGRRWKGTHMNHRSFSFWFLVAYRPVPPAAPDLGVPSGAEEQALERWNMETNL